MASEIAAEILKNQYISEQDFARITHTTEKKHELLTQNIFVMLPQSMRVAFHSKPVERVARQLVGPVVASGRGCGGSLGAAAGAGDQ